MKRLTVRVAVASAIAACLAVTASPTHAEPAPSTSHASQEFRVLKRPQFAPTGTTVRVGEPVERVIGDYGIGIPFHGFRLRDGQKVANGYQAVYIPTAEDVGKQLIYGENARDPRTGRIITAYSDPVTVLPAEGNTPPTSSDAVQVMIDDMEKLNDVRLGPGSAGRLTGPGHVVMGNNARGSNAPDYWRDGLVHKNYASDAYWKAIIPWMYITPGPNNAATNTRVELSQIKLNILSRSTNRWTTVQTATIEGELYDKSLSGDSHAAANLRSGPNGSVAVLPPSNDLLFHGWGDLIDYNTADIKAVHVSVDSKLVLNDPNGVDDRDRAQYLIQVGADYYPDKSVRVTDELMRMKKGGGYFPGVGLSRAKTVTGQSQTFNFVTIDTAKQEPGGSISVQELRDNPPPVS